MRKRSHSYTFSGNPFKSFWADLVELRYFVLIPFKKQIYSSTLKFIYSNPFFEIKSIAFFMFFSFFQGIKQFSNKDEHFRFKSGRHFRSNRLCPRFRLWKSLPPGTLQFNIWHTHVPTS